VGIKATGNWDVHPDLEEEPWYQEEHKIKKWTELGELEMCCLGQLGSLRATAELRRVELRATFLPYIT